MLPSPSAYTVGLVFRPMLTFARAYQVVLLLVIAATVAQLVVQIINFPSIWFGDIRAWTTILTIFSLALVFSVQWVEHARARNANGVVLFFWLFLLIAYAVKLRSLVSQQVYHTGRPYFVTYTLGFGLSVLAFLLEWLWPKSTSTYEALVDDEGEECPAEYATVFSKLTFSWMTPMMKHGYKQFLTEEDLWGLQQSDKTSTTGDQFEKAWQYELKHRKNPSLWLALFKAYGLPYLLATVFKVLNDLAAFSQPQLLRYLIAFCDSYENGRMEQPVVKGAAIAIAMFFVACLQTAMIVRCPRVAAEGC